MLIHRTERDKEHDKEILAAVTTTGIVTDNLQDFYDLLDILGEYNVYWVNGDLASSSNPSIYLYTVSEEYPIVLGTDKNDRLGWSKDSNAIQKATPYKSIFTTSQNLEENLPKM